MQVVKISSSRFYFIFFVIIPISVHIFFSQRLSSSLQREGSVVWLLNFIYSLVSYVLIFNVFEFIKAMIFANQILYKQFVGGDVTRLKGISILLKNSRRHIHTGFTKKIAHPLQ